MAAVPGHVHPIGALYIDAILLIVTSQGQQIPLRSSHWTVETLCMDSS